MQQLVLFTVEEKLEQSTSSIQELRVPIFAPIQKISGNSITAKKFKENGNKRHIKTSWGEVELRGRTILTQVHKDILDCVFSNNNAIVKGGDGLLTIYFSQYKVLQAYMAYEESNMVRQLKWLRDKLEEIRDTTIKYKNNKGQSFDFNVIRNIDYDEEYKSYGIKLDERYLRFFESELSINYQKELPRLLQVDDALFRALIRWFFTHKDESKYKLLTVLEALAFPIDSPKELQRARKKFRDNFEILKTFGIDYDPSQETFYYRGNQNVGFIPSLNLQFENSKKSVEKPSLDEFVGKRLNLEDTSEVIVSIEEDTEGDFLKSITIKTESDSFMMQNKDNLEKSSFLNQLKATLSMQIS
jgi:hypothetical protein